VRELEAVLEHLAHTTEHAVLQLDDLPTTIQLSQSWDRHGGSQLEKQYDHLEREAILRAGRAVGGHLGRTAQQLGISRSTLWRKMREHGLSRTDLWQLNS
jgi:transcriptional activator for dhaKLM operon